ncbi:MAG: hypothetical protein L3K11_08490 [Thermoplasmata archaeon]|nr:hypothetical protein [Thermoplasmata archaeon]
MTGKLRWNRWALAVGVALVLGLSFASAVALPGSHVRSAPTNSRAAIAGGSSNQWAFGGNDSTSYSCTSTSCFGGNGSGNLSFTLSLSYYIAWVVIYTETNVSASQTMVEGQAALNASVNLHLSECVPTGSGSGCSTETLSLTLSGLEKALGFTNVTTGTVLLTPSGGGNASSVAAQAIMNSASTESFNFSGSFSESGIPTGPGTTTSGSANFDIGASETSSASFSPALGIVPLHPVPGDSWTSSAPYTASGSYSDGYSFSATIAGHSNSSSNWTHGTVAPSGTLDVNGSDLGSFTLYDNYTNPATTVTAQEIALDFGSGAFAAGDGWVLVPTGMFGFLGGSLGVLGHTTVPAVGAHPAAGAYSSLTNGETAYYQSGTGFIGASATGNASLAAAAPGAPPQSIHLRAGPEPVSVAEHQYQSIISSAGGSSTASSFPLGWLVVGVVIAALLVGICLIALRRSSRRRQPPAMAPPGVAPGWSGPPGYPYPTQPTPGAPPTSPPMPGPGGPPQ